VSRSLPATFAGGRIYQLQTASSCPTLVGQSVVDGQTRVVGSLPARTVAMRRFGSRRVAIGGRFS
jgi:hypothetical protein